MVLPADRVRWIRACGKLVRVGDCDGEVIETWRPVREHWVWRLVAIALGAFFIATMLTILLSAIRDGVASGIWLGAVGLVITALAMGAPLWNRWSRMEIRRDGMLLTTPVRRRFVAWAELARVEVDDVALPWLQTRGPCLVLVLKTRRRIRLRLTERPHWSHDRNLDELEQMAERLRPIRCECERPQTG